MSANKHPKSRYKVRRMRSRKGERYVYDEIYDRMLKKVLYTRLSLFEPEYYIECIEKNLEPTQERWGHFVADMMLVYSVMSGYRHSGTTATDWDYMGEKCTMKNARSYIENYRAVYGYPPPLSETIMEYGKDPEHYKFAP